MRSRSLKIAITAGDPAGIGPEVALKAVNSYVPGNASLILIAGRRVLEGLYPGLFSGYIGLDRESIRADLDPSLRYFYDADAGLSLPVPGAGSEFTGRESLNYIDEALALWENKCIDAIVTGPVNKYYINSCGIKFTGHTEYIASRVGNKKPFMMMYSSELRVILMTTHIPLARVSFEINKESLLELILTAEKNIKAIDGGHVKLAIAGLDPHCGDEGAIGDFDMNVTRKAVDSARAAGIDIHGPFAADTLFMKEKWSRYNLAIAMYHDQGLIPFKALSFEKGVNVTLGLDVVRTSVDHGTAYDIAGTGKASYTSMLEAIECAYRLCPGAASDG